MIEPTFRDVHDAVKFVTDRRADSDNEAAHALAWLIAAARDRERSLVVAFLRVKELDRTADEIENGTHRGDAEEAG